MGRTLAYCTSAERDGYQRNTCCHESGDNTRVQNRLLPQLHLKSLGTCCRESCSIAIVLHMPRRSLEPKLKVSQDSRVKRMASQTESAAPLCSLTQQPCRDLVHQHDLGRVWWFRKAVRGEGKPSQWFPCRLVPRRTVKSVWKNLRGVANSCRALQ